MHSQLAQLPWFEDEHLGCWVAAFELPSWEDFRDPMGDPRYQGSKVELRLFDAEVYPPAAANSSYARAFDWLVANDICVHTLVMRAMEAFLPTLREEWIQFDDPELADIRSVADLKSVFNLAYVKLFPHAKAGLPYIGLDFDCAWDSEGFRVLINGARVVELRTDDLTSAIESDGGSVGA